MATTPSEQLDKRLPGPTYTSVWIDGIRNSAPDREAKTVLDAIESIFTENPLFNPGSGQQPLLIQQFIYERARILSTLTSLTVGKSGDYIEEVKLTEDEISAIRQKCASCKKEVYQRLFRTLDEGKFIENTGEETLTIAMADDEQKEWLSDDINKAAVNYLKNNITENYANHDKEGGCDGFERFSILKMGREGYLKTLFGEKLMGSYPISILDTEKMLRDGSVFLLQSFLEKNQTLLKIRNNEDYIFIPENNPMDELPNDLKVQLLDLMRAYAESLDSGQRGGIKKMAEILSQVGDGMIAGLMVNISEFGSKDLRKPFRQIAKELNIMYLRSSDESYDLFQRWLCEDGAYSAFAFKILHSSHDLEFGREMAKRLPVNINNSFLRKTLSNIIDTYQQNIIDPLPVSSSNTPSGLLSFDMNPQDTRPQAEPEIIDVEAFEPAEVNTRIRDIFNTEFILGLLPYKNIKFNVDNIKVGYYDPRGEIDLNILHSVDRDTRKAIGIKELVKLFSKHGKDYEYDHSYLQKVCILCQIYNHIMFRIYNTVLAATEAANHLLQTDGSQPDEQFPVQDLVGDDYETSTKGKFYTIDLDSGAERPYYHHGKQSKLKFYPQRINENTEYFEKLIQDFVRSIEKEMGTK